MSSVGITPSDKDGDLPEVPDGITAIKGERDGTVRVYDEAADDSKEAWIEGTTVEGDSLP